MAASFNFTLPGVAEQMAAAVTEFLKNHKFDVKTPSATSIGKAVGKNVADVLDNALIEVKKPAFDASSLREQILANADAILDLYNNNAIKRYITGSRVTITGFGEKTQAELVLKSDHCNLLFRHLSSLVVVPGPYMGSNIDALVALHESVKVALFRARSLALINNDKCNGPYAFSDFAELGKMV